MSDRTVTPRVCHPSLSCYEVHLGMPTLTAPATTYRVCLPPPNCYGIPPGMPTPAAPTPIYRIYVPANILQLTEDQYTDMLAPFPTATPPFEIHTTVLPFSQGPPGPSNEVEPRLPYEILDSALKPSVSHLMPLFIKPSFRPIGPRNILRIPADGSLLQQVSPEILEAPALRGDTSPIRFPDLREYYPAETMAYLDYQVIRTPPDEAEGASIGLYVIFSNWAVSNLEPNQHFGHDWMRGDVFIAKVVEDETMGWGYGVNLGSMRRQIGNNGLSGVMYDHMPWSFIGLPIPSSGQGHHFIPSPLLQKIFKLDFFIHHGVVDLALDGWKDRRLERVDVESLKKHSRETKLAEYYKFLLILEEQRKETEGMIETLIAYEDGKMVLSHEDMDECAVLNRVNDMRHALTRIRKKLKVFTKEGAESEPEVKVMGHERNHSDQAPSNSKNLVAEDKEGDPAPQIQAQAQEQSLVEAIPKPTVNGASHLPGPSQDAFDHKRTSSDRTSQTAADGEGAQMQKKTETQVNLHCEPNPESNQKGKRQVDYTLLSNINDSKHSPSDSTQELSDKGSCQTQPDSKAADQISKTNAALPTEIHDAKETLKDNTNQSTKRTFTFPTLRDLRATIGNIRASAALPNGVNSDKHALTDKKNLTPNEASSPSKPAIKANGTGQTTKSNSIPNDIATPSPASTEPERLSRRPNIDPSTSTNSQASTVNGASVLAPTSTEPVVLPQPANTEHDLSAVHPPTINGASDSGPSQPQDEAKHNFPDDGLEDLLGGKVVDDRKGSSRRKGKGKRRDVLRYGSGGGGSGTGFDLEGGGSGMVARGEVEERKVWKMHPDRG